MKTLRRIMAVGLLLGSYHVGIAQSNSVPKFASDAEKAAWKAANPNHPMLVKQEVKASATTRVAPAAAVGKSKANETKQAEVGTQNQPVRSTATRVDGNNSKTKTVAPVRAVNANLAAKRLPANYENTNKEASKTTK